MRAVLLDTHAWAWTLTDDKRLSERARAGIEQAGSVLVSPISFFEIVQKVRLGKWPEMEPLIERLPAFLDEQGGSVATSTRPSAPPRAAWPGNTATPSLGCLRRPRFATTCRSSPLIPSSTAWSPACGDASPPPGP